MFASGVIPCILFCITVFVIPESPRWNVMMGRDDQALAMLTKVSNAAHAQNLLKEIKDSLHQDQQQQHRKLNYGDVRVRFILFVGCMIAMLQQVTGVNVMMYYAPVVLKTVTENAQEALFQTIWIGVLQLVGSVIGAMLMDRMGRIPLMRYGTLGAIAGLLLTSYALYTRGHRLFRAVRHAVLHGVLCAVTGRRRTGAGVGNLPKPHARAGDEHCRRLHVGRQLRGIAVVPNDQRPPVSVLAFPRRLPDVDLRRLLPVQLLVHRPLHSGNQRRLAGKMEQVVLAKRHRHPLPDGKPLPLENGKS